MKYPIALAVGALSLSACGQPASETETNAPNAAETAQPSQTYSGTGTVTAISGDQVTIDHGPIEGIGWPAMTMTFAAPDDMARQVDVGSEVSFSFRQNGSSYELTSIAKR